MCQIRSDGEYVAGNLLTRERISWYSAHVSILDVDVPYEPTNMRWRDEIEENGLQGWVYVNVVRRGPEQDTD